MPRQLYCVPLLLVSGCYSPSYDAFVSTNAEIIYDADDRLDAYAVQDSTLRDLALRSSVAMVGAASLRKTAEGKIVIAADALGTKRNLCREEAFADQPATAVCSGVLVDDSLVLTAGHCATRIAACQDQFWIFNYAMTRIHTVSSLSADDVYRCRSVLVSARYVDVAGHDWDYAVVELDRAVVPPRRPVRLAIDPVQMGDAMTVIGYPNGLPVKVTGRSLVVDTRTDFADYFVMASDTFDVNSGSGVFDSAGQLVGIFVRGSEDYEYRTDEDCFVTRRIHEPTTANEQVSHWQPALACLCGSNSQNYKMCLTLPSDTGACPEATVVTLPAESALATGCALAVAPPNWSLLAILLGTCLFVRRLRTCRPLLAAEDWSRAEIVRAPCLLRFRRFRYGENNLFDELERMLGDQSVEVSAVEPGGFGGVSDISAVPREQGL